MSELTNLLTIETIIMGAVLIFIIITAIIILIKLKPLKDFDEVKFGKFELKRGKEDKEHEKRQDELLKSFSESLESFKIRIDSLEKLLSDISKRQDIHYKFIKNSVIAANQVLVWGNEPPPFAEVIRAGLMLAKLDQNGNLVDRMRNIIISKGKIGIKDYQYELNRFINEHKERGEALNSQFWKTISKIKEGLY